MTDTKFLANVIKYDRYQPNFTKTPKLTYQRDPLQKN